jgi:hypothetical protein
MIEPMSEKLERACHCPKAAQGGFEINYRAGAKDVLPTVTVHVSTLAVVPDCVRTSSEDLRT